MNNTSMVSALRTISMISDNGFLVNVERCLTYWNEEESDISFPDWIKPEWHNALAGGLRCQEACPEHRPFASSFEEGPSFDEEAPGACAEPENTPS